MIEYKKMDSEIQILVENFELKNKKIVDVGCGVGKIAKSLSEEGAFVFGVDLPEIIEKSKDFEQGKNVILKAGTAQEMPFESDFADIVLFFYSLHHVPEEYMQKAISEAMRVVKKDGMICFLEPVSEEDTYYILSRLMNDEAEIQKTAYGYIKRASEDGLRQVSELFFYFYRGFERFKQQVDIYITDEVRRTDLLNKAKDIIIKRNETVEKAQLKSLCRMNVMKIKGEIE